MKKLFNALGILISISSILSLTDPYTWFFHLPVVFALGCIVYCLGDTIDGINKKNKQ